MTTWGVLLLASYVGFGLSRLERRTATTCALAATAIVLLGVALKHGAL